MTDAGGPAEAAVPVEPVGSARPAGAGDAAGPAGAGDAAGLAGAGDAARPAGAGDAAGSAGAGDAAGSAGAGDAASGSAEPAGETWLAGSPGENGFVYLVGAGPGDPGLLTRRGAELLARADVVVHDRLSDRALLALAPPGAELIDVGKQPDDRGDQDAINELLVAKARAGLRVVRLKGGDPFVFGRGGEEAMALAAGGVPFEVVPGVTSAVAAPAAAGVPVTHRGLTGSFTVVAGHRRSVELPPGEGGTNWEALAAAGGTIVVLMGAAHRKALAKRLIVGGLSPATPVLAVRWGTEPYQTAIRTTLAELGTVPLEPPVAIVIGQVAAMDLRDHNRIGERPLAGKSVVVTRPAHEPGDLAARLRDVGAHVIEVPVIAIDNPADGGQALAAAVVRMAAGAYEWVVFTSANAVERLFALVPDARAFGTAKVAAVGPATAQALRRSRIVADLMPEDHSAGGLVRVFPAPAPAQAPAQSPAAPSTPDSTGRRTVIIPQAAGARPQLRRGLEGLGWQVDVAEAYRTVPRLVPEELLHDAGRAGVICFASPSAVTSYLDQAEAAGAAVPPVIACIGPSTAAAVSSRGLPVTVEASDHTGAGLVAALAAALVGGGA